MPTGDGCVLYPQLQAQWAEVVDSGGWGVQGQEGIVSSHFLEVGAFYTHADLRDILDVGGLK
jgi:hypothetical protein